MINVLFIDDDQIELKVISRHFKKNNACNFHQACSLAEARQIMESNTIDIVFSDYHLGPDSGLDIVGIYPDNDTYILSGSDLSAIEKAKLDEVNVNLIIKDFDLNYLTTMEEIIMKKSTSA